MKVLRKMKKGFTIVELVIVIAVIAVLTAILVPTFVSISNKADKASDQSLKDYLNKALGIVESDPDLNTNGTNPTMHYAVEDLDNYGISLDKIVTKSDEKLVWNQTDNRFYFESQAPAAVADRLNYWRIQTNDNDDEGYSIYAGANFVEPDDGVDVSVGFDAGYNENIDLVKYTSVSKKTVNIRTNGGSLIVNDAGTNGKVYHYGTLGNADVATDDNCFYTHGKIAALAISTGRAVANDGGYVALVEAAAGAKVEEDGGVVYIPSGTAPSAINADVIEDLGYEVSGDEIVEQPGTDKSYVISTKDDLRTFRDAWNNGSVTGGVFKLGANINISGEDWLPIGTWEYPFNGTFDGNSKTITGLTKTRLSNEDIYSTGTTTKYMGVVFGLFAIVGGGDVEVKDLTMANVNIDLPTGIQVGSVIGYAPNNGNFKDTSKAGEYAPKYENNDSIGKDDVTLTNITVSGSIKAKQHVGGVIGKVYSTGDLTVTGCVNNSNLVVSSGNCAGIVGYLAGPSTSMFDGCVNNGNIASTYFAGIVNSANSITLTVQNSSNTGSFIWTDSTYKTLGWQSASTDTDKWGFIANSTELNNKTLTNNTNTGTFTFGSYTIKGPSDGKYSYDFADSNGHVLTLNLRNHFFSLKISDTITYSGRWAIGVNPANEGSFMMRSSTDWSPLYAEVKNVKTADAFVLTDANSTFGAYNLSFNITGEELTLLKTLIAIVGDDGNSSWNVHL